MTKAVEQRTNACLSRIPVTADCFPVVAIEFPIMTKKFPFHVAVDFLISIWKYVSLALSHNMQSAKFRHLSRLHGNLAS